jgi:cysteine desulfurase/selenocysteine lyase
MEHHSNIVPYKCFEKNRCVLKVIPMNQEGELIMARYDKLLSEKTKIVATIHISNALESTQSSI